MRYKAAARSLQRVGRDWAVRVPLLAVKRVRPGWWMVCDCSVDVCVESNRAAMFDMGPGPSRGEDRARQSRTWRAGPRGSIWKSMVSEMSRHDLHDVSRGVASCLVRGVWVRRP